MSRIFLSLILSLTLYAKPSIQNADDAYNDQQFTKAFTLYQQAADKNDSKAFHQLGIMYELGQGIDQNFTKAMEYYKQSAEMGNPDGYYNVALMYEQKKGVPRDLNTSIRYYTYAADRGHVRSQHNLAHLYDDPKSPFHDDQKAFHYYKKAYDQGFELSTLGLANHYAIGAGCDKDESKAVELYKKVLLSGDNARAQYNVALLIARGLGHAKNDLLACALWENNAALGEKDSGYNRNIIKKRMSPNDIKECEALAKDRKKMIDMITPLKKLAIHPK